MNRGFAMAMRFLLAGVAVFLLEVVASHAFSQAVDLNNGLMAYYPSTEMQTM